MFQANLTQDNHCDLQVILCEPLLSGFLPVCLKSHYEVVPQSLAITDLLELRLNCSSLFHVSWASHTSTHRTHWTPGPGLQPAKGAEPGSVGEEPPPFDAVSILSDQPEPGPVHESLVLKTIEHLIE